MNADVQRFFDAVPEASKAYFNQMHALVMELYPEATTAISYGIPIYKAKSGWVGLGFWKDGVSIYTNGLGHLAEFRALHPKVKGGKGSLNFKNSEPLPLADLKLIIVHAIEHPKDV